MEQKRLLVLANSVKNEARCVAGREILTHRGQRRLGPWLRPVSPHGEGALSQAETTCLDGRTIAVLDFAEVSLAARKPDAVQPENWLIASPKPWRRLMSAPVRPNWAALCESPPQLWLDPTDSRTDRIAPAVLARTPPTQSLYLIRTPDLQLKFWTEHNEYKNRDLPKSRAVFTYNGVAYSLSLTDPAVGPFYCPRYPAVGEEPLILPVSGKDGPFLCVSLTPAFNGYHYKVAATVFEA